MKIVPGIFIILLVFFAVPMSAELVQIQIDNPSSAVRDWLLSQDYQVNEMGRGHQIGCVIPRSELAVLEARNIPYRIVQTETEIYRELPGYHDYQEVLDSLNWFAATYPGITSLTSLGPSLGNLYYQDFNSAYQDFQNEIWCLKVSDNPTVEEDEPNIFFMGGIHAREPISVEVTLHIMEHILANYTTSDSIASWVDHRQIWFVPLINPDGARVIHEQYNLSYRKNLRDNNDNGVPDYGTGSYPQPDGVDLNRNFSYVWGDNGSTINPNSITYHGTEPFSEPETSYLYDLITTRTFIGGITYHSYGEWVLYPLGHYSGACSWDHAVMDELATQMALTIPSINNTGGHYTPSQATALVAQGTMGDWGYAEQRIFSFTVELARTFIPPQSQVAEICGDNLQAALIFLSRPDDRMITGNITDENGNPLVADVFVAGIDDQAGMSTTEPARSGMPFGRYNRPLLPGTYDVTFTRDGYLPAHFYNVPVVTDSVTELDVTLYHEIVPDVQISVSEGTVTLSWTGNPAFDYEVYTALTPYEEMTLVPDGTFLDDHTWQHDSPGNMQFYVVRRMPGATQ